MLELEERLQTLGKRGRNAWEMPVSLHPNLAGNRLGACGRPYSARTGANGLVLRSSC